VDAGTAKTTCKDGMLEITLRESEGSKRHTIDID
jgi:HSP20 family molecular chaperone IbpA